MEGFALISGAFLLNSIFGYFSMGFALYLSFFSWDFIGPMKFVGLYNYFKAFREIWRGLTGAPPFFAPFFVGMRNILLYTAVVVPVQTFLAIILAVLANQRIKGATFYKVSYFLPSVTCSVIVSLIFVWLFQKNGFINYMISRVTPGFAPNWLMDDRYALWAIMLVAIWGTSGNLMVSFLAALQAIPNELYEAAIIDGAGRVRRFVSITLPMLRPMIAYAVVLGTIGCLQMFDLSFVMTGGGPAYATYTMALDIYNTAFINLDPGLASAKAWILFALTFVATYLVQRKYSRLAV